MGGAAAMGMLADRGSERFSTALISSGADRESDDDASTSVVARWRNLNNLRSNLVRLTECDSSIGCERYQYVWPTTCWGSADSP